VIDVGDEPRLFGSPVQQRPGPLARGRGIYACECRKPAEVPGRLFGRLRDDRNVQTAAEHLGDRLERHALFGNGMEVALRAALEREPLDAGGVEAVHGRPAILSLANIGRHALLARDSDKDRHEAVIAVSMHRRGEPDG
jgi:hypothetical protein